MFSGCRYGCVCVRAYARTRACVCVCKGPRGDYNCKMGLMFEADLSQISRLTPTEMASSPFKMVPGNCPILELNLGMGVGWVLELNLYQQHNVTLSDKRGQRCIDAATATSALSGPRLKDDGLSFHIDRISFHFIFTRHTLHFQTGKRDNTYILQTFLEVRWQSDF